MNNKIISISAFFAGIISGSIVTYIFVKKKYEKIAQEEIDSVKEVYSNRAASLGSALSKKVIEVQDAMANMSKSAAEAASKLKKNFDVHIDLARNEDATSNLNTLYANESPCITLTQDPYIITGGEFAQDNDYVKMGLMYCNDGSVVYEDGTIVSDISAIVGDECAMKIDESEEESIYIRDDSKCIDYEIIKDVYDSSVEEDYE